MTTYQVLRQDLDETEDAVYYPCGEYDAQRASEACKFAAKAHYKEVGETQSVVYTMVAFPVRSFDHYECPVENEPSVTVRQVSKPKPKKRAPAAAVA